MGKSYDACREAGSSNAKRITVVIGPDGNVRSVYDTVKPDEHPREVLASL